MLMSMQLQDVPKKQAPTKKYKYIILKPGNKASFSVKFECKRSTRILQVSSKYSMRDLTHDVIIHCARNGNMSIISVSDKYQSKPEKNRKDGIRR